MKKLILLVLLLVPVAACATMPEGFIGYSTVTWRGTKYINGDLYMYNSTPSATTNFEIKSGSITKCTNITVSGNVKLPDGVAISTNTAVFGADANCRASTGTIQTQLNTVALSTGTLYNSTTNYLDKSGGTMSGSINMNGNIALNTFNILNVATVTTNVISANGNKNLELRPSLNNGIYLENNAGTSKFVYDSYNDKILHYVDTDFGNKQITNISSITVTGKITLADGTILTSTSTLGGGGAHASSFAMGKATATIDMNSNNIINVSTITANSYRGYNCTATGLYSTALGNSSAATGLNSLAMGDGVTASGVESVAIGAILVASGDNSTAIGDFVEAHAVNSLVFGLGDFDLISPLTNDIPNSFMVGFNSTLPELTVFGSSTIINGTIQVDTMTVTGTLTANNFILPMFSTNSVQGLASVRGSVVLTTDTYKVMKQTSTIAGSGWGVLP